MSNPIGESLPYDSALPSDTQSAWVCTIRVLIPHTDVNGTPVRSEAAASDYLSETLRGQFLDWGFADEGLHRTVVVDPYVEGTM
jgi:hypothetical protein